MSTAPSLQRLLVVLPNWVGDVVLATPVLAALRTHLPHARITFLMRRYVSEIVAGGGWHDQSLYWPQDRRSAATLGDDEALGTTRRLRQERFDTALLLTNSFRSAATAWWAGIPRRVGYSRDARGWMLTDRLYPLKRDGAYVPGSVLPYYAKLANVVGCPVTDWQLRLGLTPAQEQGGAELLRHYGLADGTPYALVNPGAAFGAAKCWLPERFSVVCDRLAREHGLRAVIVGNAGTERPLMRRIAEMAREPVVCADRPPTTLGTLKVLARGARLLICNDTGPRHYGIAFGVPTVTIFGPTHQEWTDTGYTGEIKLQVPVECGPCQLKVCPVDLRCMTGLTTDMVMRAVTQVLGRRHATVPAGVAARELA